MKTSKRSHITVVIIREVKRIVSRPLYILCTLIFPLLSIGILWAIFQEGVPRDLPVAIYDADNSAMSRRLKRMIDATPSVRIIRKVTSMESGKEFILSGKSYGLIILPKQMEQDVISGYAPHVIGFYNNQLMLPGSLISRDIRSAVGTLSAGLDMKLRQKQGEMNEEARAHLEPIRVESRVLSNPYLNYLYFLLATLLPSMLQIFIITVSVHALGVELKEKTAGEWLKAAGNSTLKALIGKFLPYTVLFLVLGFFINSFLYRYIGVPLNGSLAIISLATILFVLAYQSLGLLFVAATSNLRLATSFALFYAAPAFAFVGITFPIMAMPQLGKIWAGALPLTYYLQIIVDQSIRGAPVTISSPALVYLAAFLIPGPILALFRMKKLMQNERYWGRQ